MSLMSTYKLHNELSIICITDVLQIPSHKNYKAYTHTHTHNLADRQVKHRVILFALHKTLCKVLALIRDHPIRRTREGLTSEKKTTTTTTAAKEAAARYFTAPPTPPTPPPPPSPSRLTPSKALVEHSLARTSATSVVIKA